MMRAFLSEKMFLEVLPLYTFVIEIKYKGKRCVGAMASGNERRGSVSLLSAFIRAFCMVESIHRFFAVTCSLTCFNNRDSPAHSGSTLVKTS